MYENKVWTLVDFPDDQQAIENKWIFKRKTDTDSSVTIYKARLVAKGFRQVQSVEHETSDSVTTKPRRSSKVQSTPEWYGNPVLEIMLLDHDESTTYQEATMSTDSAKWLEAMISEMGSMYENKLWTSVNLPDDRQAIDNKWIFKKKTDAV